MSDGRITWSSDALETLIGATRQRRRRRELLGDYVLTVAAETARELADRDRAVVEDQL